MSNSRVALLVCGSIIVSTLWTMMTGQWWQWFPVSAAIAVSIGMMRSVE